MAEHDPLCTYGPEWDRMKGGARGCPECDLIATAEARARADERRQVVLDHESGIVYRDIIEAEVRERIAQEIELLLPSTHDLYDQGVRDAARIARGGEHDG